jgi:glycosyltransferase involved in cell wall biosynthesis
LISAVIPTFDRRPVVGDAVESALAQQLPCQVVVVDDGSSDGTAASLRARFGSRIEVISVAHRGRSAARNTGVEAASGELIAFLDSDDLWFADKLSEDQRILEQQPGAVLAAAPVVVTGLDGVVDKRATARHRWRLRRMQLSGFSLESIARQCPLFTSAVTVRRDAFREAGGFDPSLETYEDLDLYARLSALGGCAWHSRPLVTHRTHPGNTGGADAVAAEEEFGIRQLHRVLGAELQATHLTVANLMCRRMFSAYASRRYKDSLLYAGLAAVNYPGIALHWRWWRPVLATVVSAPLGRQEPTNEVIPRCS